MTTSEHVQPIQLPGEDVSLDKPASPNYAHVLIGGAFLACSMMLVAGALALPQDKGYTIIGAQAFPFAVAFLLFLVGAGLTWQGIKGGFRFLPADCVAAAPLGRKQVRSALWISAGLLVNALLITQVGFVLSSTLLFVAAARAFGSTRWVKDILIGLALTVPVYLGFTQGLGVPLPALIISWI